MRDKLEVMEVVRLGGREEGQVVARVRGQGVGRHEAEPQPHRGEVGAHEEGAQGGRGEVAQEMLHGVAVHGGKGDGGRPLVVLLVDVFVKKSTAKIIYVFSKCN